MILLDTTVLVYAVGADHTLREPCRTIVRSIGEGRLTATTTVEVIQEFAHVRAKRRGRTDASRSASAYARLLSPLLSPDDEDLQLALDIFAVNDRIGAFDAVLGALVRRHDRVRAIVSADRGFASLDGVAHVDPGDERAVAALLDGDIP